MAGVNSRLLTDKLTPKLVGLV